MLDMIYVNPIHFLVLLYGFGASQSEESAEVRDGTRISTGSM